MKILINNNRVWNPLSTGAEIVCELIDNANIVIDFKGEAPTLRDTELYEVFNFLESRGIDLKRITVLTTNALEDYAKVNIEFIPEEYYEIELFQHNLGKIPNTKSIKYHFGNLVSRTNAPRLVLASHLYAKYKNITFQTFHYNSPHDYHKTHLGLEELLHIYGADSEEFSDAIKLIKNSPMTQDKIEKYPIVPPENIFVPCNWYPYIFVDIICESWYTGTNFFITEKFWRAVATKTPFIIQGPQNILANLKKLGFKTFDSYWDEGYSEDPSFHNLVEIKKVLNTLSKKSIAELNIIYTDMQSILNHNYEVLQNMSCFDIKHKLMRN